MVMSPASPARFLGEGTLALVKEWPRKGVLDKEGGTWTIALHGT
jgi:hypothetical protein